MSTSSHQCRRDLCQSNFQMVTRKPRTRSLEALSAPILITNYVHATDFRSDMDIHDNNITELNFRRWRNNFCNTVVAATSLIPSWVPRLQVMLPSPTTTPIINHSMPCHSAVKKIAKIDPQISTYNTCRSRRP